VTSLVAITVDVDGEAGLPDGGRGYEQRLSSRSERLYGLRRGLPRILALLDEVAVEATFFVPGVTAGRHRDEVCAILEAGHEVGHHGHAHRRLDGMSDAEQHSDLEDGIAAISALSGAAPLGYRAPCWELTPLTLRLLGEHGFEYDSSLMGDDRPYVVRAGPRELVELPVHWSLDDAPHFATTTDPTRLTQVWCDELSLAAREHRPITFTLHPDILGRPYRLDVLRRVLDAARSFGCEPARLSRLASLHAGEQQPRLDVQRPREPDDRREPWVADASLEP
jgi:peptidoglycan/xylan/chitin deacetylase (PgdA/CDA1 family)